MAETEKEMLDKLYDLVIDKMQHDLWVHGAGFCQTCGELQKRCECEEFNNKWECNCK